MTLIWSRFTYEVGSGKGMFLSLSSTEKTLRIVHSINININNYIVVVGLTVLLFRRFWELIESEVSYSTLHIIIKQMLLTTTISG